MTKYGIEEGTHTRGEIPITRIAKKSVCGSARIASKKQRSYFSNPSPFLG